jgi:ribulose-phosphate 3-epimerase
MKRTRRFQADEKAAASEVRIAPSILSADFSRLGDEIRSAERAGADAIHVDVMDGRFVPNITIGPPVVAHLRACTRLSLDVHLMIVEPERFLRAFTEAGADVLYVHPEACVHLHRVLGRIRELGRRAAVALNPATPVATLEDVLGDVDRVLIMTVNPGFGGQRFIPSMLPKISRLRDMVRAGGRTVEIEVDGGISPETAASVVRAGATHLVAGSALFNEAGIASSMRRLRKAAQGG